VVRHEPLTDKLNLYYYEPSKIPKSVSRDNRLELWLALFRAETEEELKEIEAMEVDVMTQAIGAYRKTTATAEFKELERLRSLARHNEASALGHARREEAKKWQGVVAEVVAEKEREIAEAVAAMEAKKDAQIAELLAQLGEKKN